MRPIDVIGHRGARGRYPENTLIGVGSAIEAGVRSVEVDVCVTADNELVLFHDLYLNADVVRDSQGQWLTSESAKLPAVHSLTLDDLKRFDVGRLRPGSDYAKRFSEQTAVDNTPIPSFGELVTFCESRAGRDFYLTVEAKLSPAHPEASVPPTRFAELIVADYESRGRSLDHDLITSFDWRFLHAIQALDPDIRTSYLTIQQPAQNTVISPQGGASLWTNELDIRDFGGSVPEAVLAAGGNGWSPYYLDVDMEQVETAHALGIFVCVWTVNDAAEIERMMSMGVDMIISDYPDRVIDVVGTATGTESRLN